MICSFNISLNGCFRLFLIPILLMVGLFCNSDLYAKEQIKWLETVFDFGAFHEEEGIKRGEARFVNSGESPTVITGVRPSCGCTDANFTEGLIAPGDTAVINFGYNPEGRPGPFRKTIKVYTGSEREMSIITITGTVIGAPKSLEKDFPFLTGDLRIEQQTILLDSLQYGHTAHKFIRLYNQSDKELHPVAVSNHPALEVTVTPNALKPGEIGTLSLFFNSRQLENVLPRVDAEILLKADADRNEHFKINFVAPIKISASYLTAAELESAPVCNLPENCMDLTGLKPRGAVRKNIKIENIGKKALIIQNVIVNDNRVRILSFPHRLATGKKDKISFSIISGERENDNPERVPIIIESNDPLHPRKVFNLIVK